MAETIESFVAKLQQDGVQAGQQAADKLCAEARQQAEALLADARRQAEKIVADAKQQAEKLAARSRTELALAARDTVLRLRQALSDILGRLLTASVAQKLSDQAFLGELLRELILGYAQAERAGAAHLTIKLPDDLRAKLQDGALKEIARAAREKGLDVDVQGGLKEAGFEYSLSDAKIEVTLGSLVETLSGMVSPALREIVQQTAGEGKEGPQAR